MKYTKETAETCPNYRDSNFAGCIFSPTFERSKNLNIDGSWCNKCNTTTFVEDCLNGKAKINDIDYYIELWCKSYFKEIYDFLGITKEEYFSWVEDDSILEEIIEKYRNEKKNG